MIPKGAIPAVWRLKLIYLVYKDAMFYSVFILRVLSYQQDNII